jgi:polar amino acid transport system permease protein
MSIDWSLLADRLFSPDSEFWRALVATISIALLSEFLGSGIGLIAAFGTMARWKLVVWATAYYTLIMRGTPLVVQIFFIYYGTNLLLGFNLFPRQVVLFGFSVSGAVLAGIVALSLNEGAYMSEIIRAGIKAIDKGQLEAAQSVGMTKRLAMRRIVLPQALRIIVPPFGNQFNSMIKNTSLLAFIGVYEMFLDAQIGYSRTFKPVEYFAAVAVWYLLLTGIWTIFQIWVEHRLGVSDREEPLDLGTVQSMKFRFWRA